MLCENAVFLISANTHHLMIRNVPTICHILNWFCYLLGQRGKSSYLPSDASLRGFSIYKSLQPNQTVAT